MFALVSAFLVALIVVGTATLSGHPLEVITVAVVVAAVILAVMWRVRKLSDTGTAAPRSAAPRSRPSGPGRPGATGSADER